MLFLESISFTILHYWHLLLAMTLAPALPTAWISDWMGTSIGWRNSTLAGLGGGATGVAAAIALFGATFVLREYNVLFGYILLPIISAASAWAFRRLWQHRSRLRLSPPNE